MEFIAGRTRLNVSGRKIGADPKFGHYTRKPVGG